MSGHPLLQVIGVSDIVRPISAFAHIDPESHRLICGSRNALRDAAGKNGGSCQRPTTGWKPVPPVGPASSRSGSLAHRTRPAGWGSQGERTNFPASPSANHRFEYVAILAPNSTLAASPARSATTDVVSTPPERQQRVAPSRAQTANRAGSKSRSRSVEDVVASTSPSCLGNQTRNVEPRPGTLSTEMRPPSNSVRRRVR